MFVHVTILFEEDVMDLKVSRHGGWRSLGTEKGGNDVNTVHI